jgi:filamentous hemagglutinin family protein
MAQRWRRGRSALLLGTALQAGVVASWSYPARSQPAPNARPTGGAVSAGSASISYSPTATTIDQSSQRAAINWRSFNVGAQQSVNFVQPSASATALNRVKSPNPSQIAGKIDANGQVVLINQSGVIFYKGAQVNTAGLIVSAAGMSNANFMAGKMVFDKAARPNAAIVNQGTLTVKQAGLAALVAPRVANSGVIEAKLGHVVLAGAKTATLDLYGDGLVSLDVSNQVTQAPLGRDGKPVSALVTNTGVIRADGGTVQLTAREASGLVHNLVEAGGTITAPSVGARTGTIVLDGVGGSVVLTGAALAQGNAPGTVGGSVQIDSSADVTLASGSRVSVSGRAGGGTVAIGTTLGRAKGGPGTPSALTAQNVTMAQGAVVTANARRKGNGGRVALLSGQTTTMAGTITARGGPQGGDGGFVEVSSIGVLSYTGLTDLRAPQGELGTLLLDPTDVEISGSLSDSNITGSSTFEASGTSGLSILSALTLNTALATANVTVQTTSTSTQSIMGGAIVLDSDAAVNLHSNTLTLNANAGIVLNGTINGSGNLVLNAGGTIINNGTPYANTGITSNITIDASCFFTSICEGPSGLLSNVGSIAITSSPGGFVELTSANNTINNLGNTNVGNITLTDNTNLTMQGQVTAASFATLDVTGNVTEATNASLVTNDLRGTAASFSLPSPTNDIAEIDGLTATSGDITIVDNAPLLALNGTQSARNLFYENMATGGAIALGIGEGAVALTAAPGGRISLVADNLTEDFATNTVTATTGTIEIAPFTQGTSITLGGSGGLSLPQSILSTMATETLRIGEATINGSPTITAGSIVVTGTAGIDLASIATTLELHAAAVNGATGGITVSDPLTGSDNVYLQSDGPGGITVAGSIAAFNVGLQTDAFNMMTGGTISTFLFELAPNTPGTGMTLGASGAGLSLPSLTGISAGEVRIGAVTEPGNTLPTTTAGSINIANNFGSANISIELDATGNVTEATSASLTTSDLTGTAASFSLPSPTNAIAEIDTLTATNGDITIVDDTALLPTFDTHTVVLSGTQSARDIFYEDVEPGGTLALGLLLGEGSISPPTLTAAAGGRISLVADNITDANITIVSGDPAAIISAPDGRVELAPFSAINTSLLGSAGLVISPQLLSSITPTGTLVVGGFTNAPAGGVTPTPSASSVTIDSAINLTGTATTLDLLATGAVTEPGGPVTVNTLIGDAGSATLSNPGTPSAAANNNDISTLGSFTTTTGGFILADNGNPGTLSVTGPVSAATNVALSDGTTGGVSASGAIAAGTTLSIVTGSGGIALVNGGSLTGTTVDLSSTGGLSEVAGGTITAGTLQSTGGISGGAATLAGASNAIAALGNFPVSGGTFSLSDTGALAVDGAVSASSVTIGGNAGSTPLGITLLSGGSVAAPTVALSAGASGIALDSGAMLGETGASIDLASTGGISENAGATIIAATLASLNSVTGGAVTLAGAANAIGDLGSFTVLGNGFSLSDQASLDISGLLSASSVTIGGNAGSTPTGITLGGTGSIAAPSVTLTADGSGISISDGASLGQAGAIVGLTTTGAVTEASGGAVDAGTLSVTASTVSLPSVSNAVSALGNSTATSLSLDDSTDLLIAATLNAADISLLAPNNQISLGNGATIITGGVTPPIPGPINPSEEPSNGAPGAFIEAARFTQIGSSTLAGQGGGPDTLELTVSTSASFDPPLGLIAPNGWLILNLGNGTATGDVFVNALNVTHTVPGAAALDGTIDGVAGPGASILGANQPTVDPAYTFNGCEIGAGCPPPTQLLVASSPPLPTPPPPTQLIVATGPLYPALQNPLPPLATLTPLVLLAYPLWPAGGEALTDPDVVPPNVSYVDY